MDSIKFNLEAGIPTLDLKRYTEGNEEDKKAFAAELGAAYRQVGFAAISGHGVSEELITNMYDRVKRFFSLSKEDKLKYINPEGDSQRGFVKFGQEHAKGNDNADLKEFWQVGQTKVPPNADLDYYAPNVFVDQLPDFSTISDDLYNSLGSVGLIVLEAIAMHLELPLDYFTAQTYGGNSILRAIHYPPISSEPQSAVRSAEHEDINLITLLIGASASGLQVMGVDGKWNSVTADSEHIVMNCGDMLQRLTNHQLKSTTHRVVNPPKELWHTPRFSIPFFCHPQPQMKLNALPQCVPAGESPQDAPITAGEYLNERLAEIGLKKDNK
jgi:isopenicillin N synthase-like dioxygenase